MEPKKKQKSSSIRGHSTSSPPKEIEDKFVTLQCATNFHAAMKTRTTFIMERGFQRPPSELAQVIQSRGWDTFVKPHQPAMGTMVREFYANLPEHKDRTVFVMSLKVIYFQSIFLIDFYTKRLIYMHEFAINFTKLLCSSKCKRKQKLQ